MIRIIESERVTWKTWKPFIAEDFPCFVCRKEIATYKVKYENKNAIITKMICYKCFKDLKNLLE